MYWGNLIIVEKNWNYVVVLIRFCNNKIFYFSFSRFLAGWKVMGKSSLKKTCKSFVQYQFDGKLRVTSLCYVNTAPCSTLNEDCNVYAWKQFAV